jgi:hypothetical protein
MEPMTLIPVIKPLWLKEPNLASLPESMPGFTNQQMNLGDIAIIRFLKSDNWEQGLGKDDIIIINGVWWKLPCFDSNKHSPLNYQPVPYRDRPVRLV